MNLVAFACFFSNYKLKSAMKNLIVVTIPNCHKSTVATAIKIYSGSFVINRIKLW